VFDGGCQLSIESIESMNSALLLLRWRALTITVTVYDTLSSTISVIYYFIYLI
jgi:hypothetical protein